MRSSARRASAHLVALLVGALVFAARAPRLAGQGRTSASLVGRISDAISDSGVADATVLVSGTLLRATTDDSGAFRIVDIAPGCYAVRVLRLGYESVVDEVTLAAGERRRLDVRLVRSAVHLEPVTITASRVERPIGDTPASQAVLSSAEIASRNAITLDQALPFVAGVVFNHGDIDIRGSTGTSGGVGSRVLVLLDGHPVLTADGGEVDFSSIPLLDIDRVEIVKGAYSALYGSNALGGVVNVVTLPIAERPQTIVTAHYGAWDTPAELRFNGHDHDFQGVELQHSRRVGDVGVRLLADREWSDGYREDDVSSRWLLRTKLELPEHAAHPTTVYANWSQEDEGNFFTWALAKLDTLSYTVDPSTLNDWEHDTKLSVGATTEPISRGSLVLRVLPYLERDGTQNHFPSAGADSTDYHDATRLGATVQLSTAPSPWQTLTIGADAAHTWIHSNFLSSSIDRDSVPTPHAVSLDDAGLYAQDEIDISPILSLSAGARLDAHRATNARRELALNPKLGIVYRPREHLSLRASLARGYRAPAGIEQYVHATQGIFHVTANLALRGERAWSSEIGATTNLRPWWWLDAALFQSWYDDLISPGVVPGSLVLFQFQNITRARIRGLDLSTRVGVIPELLDLQLNYLFIDSEDRATGLELPYRSKHNVTATAELLSGLLGVDVRHRSRVDQVLAFPGDPRSAITLVDARLAWRLRGTVVQLRASNLFQKRYVDIQERTPGAPRNVLLTAYRTF